MQLKMKHILFFGFSTYDCYGIMLGLSIFFVVSTFTSIWSNIMYVDWYSLFISWLSSEV